MLSEIQAKDAVLNFLHGSSRGIRYAVKSARLSGDNQYWIVCANSEAAIVHGDLSQMLIGVNAYLVDAQSGVIEVVGSGQNLEEYLQDKIDARAANGMQYVLRGHPDYSDPKSIIRLHQVIDCSLKSARDFLSADCVGWVTGKRRLLQWAQDELMVRGVPSTIVLMDNAPGVPELPMNIRFWDHLQEFLRSSRNA